jgi:hypothetical protein
MTDIHFCFRRIENVVRSRNVNIKFYAPCPKKFYRYNYETIKKKYFLSSEPFYAKSRFRQRTFLPLGQTRPGMEGEIRLSQDLYRVIKESLCT